MALDVITTRMKVRIRCAPGLRLGGWCRGNGLVTAGRRQTREARIE
jgi:hypothetical protein